MFIIAAPPHPRLRACPPPLRAAAAAGRTGSKPGVSLDGMGWMGRGRVDWPAPAVSESARLGLPVGRARTSSLRWQLVAQPPGRYLLVCLG